MKEKLISLLLDHAIEDPTGNSFEQRIIRDNDFSDLSSDILSLFENNDVHDALVEENKKLRAALNNIANTAIDYRTPSTDMIRVIAQNALKLK